MNFKLKEEEGLIQESTREFAIKELRLTAKENDLKAQFPLKELSKMAKLGLMGVSIPEEYGGVGASPLALTLATIEIAKECASCAITMSVTNMVAETICRFGTEEQKRKHLPKICSGEYPAGSFALTEPSIGSDAASLKTKAVKHKDRYILNGEKIFVTSGGYSGVIIVMARTQQDIGYKGITAFLVTPDMKGLIIGPAEDKMGLRASNTVSLRFEECEVPQENILGKEGEGFKIAMSALDGGRIGVAAQALGIGWAALNAAQIYAKERIQFQRPISSFQAIQWMIADSATKLQAAQLLTYKAAYLKGEKRRYTPEAAMAKVYATEVCNQVCTKAVQIHGGYGYISEFPVERYMRDARATTIYEGTSEIQRMVIAKNVLG